MDIEKSFWIIVVLFCVINIHFVHGICEWPPEFANTTWRDSSKGDIEFNTNSLTGWTITITAVSPPQQFDSWLCHSTELYSSNNILVLITEDTFVPYGQVVYGYLCVELRHITTASYRYYLHNAISPGVNYERILMSTSSNESDWNTVCLFDDVYASYRPLESEYRVLVNTDNAFDAKINCPYVFLGTYGYIHTDSSGTETCDHSTSTWSTCNVVTEMTFNYTTCATTVAYSKSDTVWCIDNVFYGGNNFVTVYNGNDQDSDIDDVITFRFACFAISSNATAASVTPGSCQNGQSPYSIPSNGASDIGATISLVQKDTCVTCPNPDAPSGGSVSFSTDGAVTIATYECDENYSLAGPEVRTCQSNYTWTDENPTCTCILPAAPANGSLIASTDGTLTYYCDVGFILNGDRTRQCQTNSNSWTGSEPVCDPCDVIDATDGLLVNMVTTGTTSVSTFTCSVGYTLDGTSEATCQSSGSWNATIPTCVLCDNVTSSNTMDVSRDSDGYVSTAEFSCVTGYQLIGDVNATCDVTGTWSQVPYCECQEPDMPANGSHVWNGTFATFACNTGYNLLGFKAIMCLDDGTGWNETSPTCEMCSTPTVLSGGYYNLSTDGSVTIATYTCYDGYSLSGAKISFCQNDGTWNDISQDCVKCPDLAAPSSGAVNVTTDGQTSVAQYSCLDGYSLSGSANNSCLLNGSWSTSPPTCYCLPATIPDDGSILSDNGETVHYECSVNYSMNGNSIRECDTNGSGWNGQDPTCVLCDTITDVIGGAVQLTTDGINTKATYTCETGYTINGSKYVTCQSDGSWNANQSNCTQCAHLPIPDNGNYSMFVSDDNTVTKLVYTCDIGYTIAGYSELTCESTGSWNRATPTCVKCQDRASPSSGNFTLSTDSLTTTGTYTCAEGYELNGIESITCTITGDWDYPEAACECIEPNAPGNGSVFVDQPTITYSCDKGFTMSGSSTGFCNTDGTSWSIDTPTCVECDGFPNVENGNITLTSTGDTTSVVVTCNAGTSILGESEIACNTNGLWDGDVPECVACPDLPDVTVTSGSVVVATNSTTTTATYNCPSGYEVKGSQTIECLANGTWSELPSDCVCEAPTVSEGGGFITADDGMSVSYTCAEGYTILGEMTTECATDGSGWLIENVNCTKCADIVAPQNGNVTLVTNGTHTSIEYSCETGYSLYGTAVSECRPNGTWTITSTQSCEPCESLPELSIADGSVVLSSNGTNTVANYSCPHGYEVKGSETITCNTNGTWESTPSDCVCETPPPLIGGNFTIADDGYSVEFRCDAGYIMNGNQMVTCSTDGSGWTLSYPSCSKCDDLTAPENGNVSLETNGTVTIAVYTCDSGTSISGASTSECQAGGIWNLTVPTCVSCPNLPSVTVTTGDIEIKTDGTTTVALYNCPFGYEVKGEQNITCTSDGTWSASASDCVCATPSAPDGGNFTLSADGLSVIFECDGGYTMVGEQELHCGVDGSGWDITYPNCTKCEDLSSPNGGNVSLTTDGVQTAAVFSCNVGSTLIGEYKPQCSENGTWTATQPQCVTCPEVSNITSGALNVSTNGTSTTAEYTCDDGYSVEGQSVRTCLPNGSWDEEAPSCYCSPPSSPSSGSVVANKTNAIYSCEEGFVLKGPQQRSCQDNGLGWTGITPSCNKCDTIIPPANGSFDLSTDGAVTLATFGCDVNFTMDGFNILSCLENGSWSNLSPNCVQCSSLSQPTDGILNTTTNGTHTVATFKCNLGSSLKGDDTTTCFDDMRWSAVEPTCETCPNLTNPNSGYVNLSTDGLTTMAQYACADGYYVSGSDVISCLVDATWSDVSPICLCDAPVLLHGNALSNGQTATFRCNVGYTLSGTTSFECRSDGTGWNDSLPNCVQCARLSDPVGGKRKLVTDGLRTRATFNCDNGRTLNGTNVLHCSPQGIWNGSIPTCVLCEDLVPPTNGQFIMSSDGEVSTIELRCNDGYEQSGTSQVQCGVDGKWDFQGKSTCEKSASSEKSLLNILIIISVISLVIIIVLSVLLARFVYLYCQRKTDSAVKYSPESKSFDFSSKDEESWRTAPAAQVLQSRAPTFHQTHVMDSRSPFAASPAPESFASSPTSRSTNSPPLPETYRSGSSIVSFRRSASTLTKNGQASVSSITITQDDEPDAKHKTPSSISKLNGTNKNIISKNGHKPISRLPPIPNHKDMIGKLNISKEPRPDSGQKSPSIVRSGTPLVMSHSIRTNDYTDSMSMDSVSTID